MTLRVEIDRVVRVSDLLCSAHSALRDKFRRRAVVLDLAILFTSSWLVAMAFVEPELGHRLAPFGLGKDLWLGLLSVFTFCLSLIQLRVDWKEKSELHKKASIEFGLIKQRARTLLADEQLDESAATEARNRYLIAGETHPPIPEADFLPLKRLHLSKLQISKYLDKMPGTPVWIVKCKLVLRGKIVE